MPQRYDNSRSRFMSTAPLKDTILQAGKSGEFSKSLFEIIT